MADDTPVWDGPTVPYTVTFELSEGEPVVHRSHAPHWRRALSLALDTTNRDGRLGNGAPVVNVRIERR